MPGFNAEVSLSATRNHYRMGGISDVLIGSGEILLQQRGIGSCMAKCRRDDWSCILNCLGGDGSFPGPTDGDGGPNVVCGCFPDASSSTGWRERCRIPGSPPFSGDECDAPGCGPCTCTCRPDCSRMCTQQCFRYGQVSGQRIEYSRPCTPIVPLPLPWPFTE